MINFFNLLISFIADQINVIGKEMNVLTHFKIVDPKLSKHE